MNDDMLDIQSVPLLAEKEQKPQEQQQKQQQQAVEIFKEETSSVNHKKELLTTAINAKKTTKQQQQQQQQNSNKINSRAQQQHKNLHAKRKSQHEENFNNDLEISPPLAKKMHKNALEEEDKDGEKEEENQNEHETNNHVKESQLENNKKNNGTTIENDNDDDDCTNTTTTTTITSAAAAATGGHKQSGSIALSSSSINKLYNNNNNNQKNIKKIEQNNKKCGVGIKRKLTREQKIAANADEADEEVLNVKLTKTTENANVTLEQQQQQQQQQIKMLKQQKSNDAIVTTTTTTTIPITAKKQRNVKKQQQQEDEETEAAKVQEMFVVVNDSLEKLEEEEILITPTNLATTTTTPTTTGALNTYEIDEQQLMQVQNDNEVEAPKILAVPTQPIPGYNETFLLCTFVNNEYKPIDNVPLYLDTELNQLVPLPAEAMIGQPELIVNQSPPQQQQQQQQQQNDEELQSQSSIKTVITEANSIGGIITSASTMSTTAADLTAQLLEVAAAAGVNVSTVMTPAIVNSHSNALFANDMLATIDDDNDDEDDVNVTTTGLTTATTTTKTTTTTTSLFDENAAELIEMNEVMMSEDVLPIDGAAAGTTTNTTNSEEEQQIVADNAIILNIEGQQIIIDAATFAQLLANPDANTQLITDDGTEFVLTREVLAALESQHALMQPEAVSPSNDILAVALAGTDLYGSDILEIETSQGLQLVCSDGSLAFQAAAAHLTPPITAQTNETNALLDQTPIMSALETPTSLATGGTSIGTKLQLAPTTVAELLAAGEENLITPNLEDSLAVIGLTTQSSSIPTSLELPITITNPAIAPKVSLAAVLPVNDAIMQFSVQPSVSIIGASCGGTYTSSDNHQSS